MKVSGIFLAALLAAAPVSAAQKGASSSKAGKSAAPAAGTADKKTVQLVDLFLKVETASLPPDQIEPFLAIDPQTLPAAKRDSYRAKRAELMALKKVMDSKTKPPIRRAGKEEMVHCPQEQVSQQQVDKMKEMGFEQITEDEVNFLSQKTKCTQCELSEEFTLLVYIVPPKKKDDYALRYFLLNASDPLMALVGQYRKGSEGGTSFFGVGFFGACR